MTQVWSCDKTLQQIGRGVHSYLHNVVVPLLWSFAVRRLPRLESSTLRLLVSISRGRSDTLAQIRHAAGRVDVMIFGKFDQLRLVASTDRPSTSSTWRCSESDPSASSSSNSRALLRHSHRTGVMSQVLGACLQWARLHRRCSRRPSIVDAGRFTDFTARTNVEASACVRQGSDISLLN